MECAGIRIIAGSRLARARRPRAPAGCNGRWPLQLHDEKQCRVCCLVDALCRGRHRRHGRQPQPAAGCGRLLAKRPSEASTTAASSAMTVIAPRLEVTMSGSMTGETERVRRIWERLAPRYDKDIKFFEKVLFSGGRSWACSQASGVVLEIGVGTGRNFEHYPAGIQLVGIDLSPRMIAIAQERAGAVGRQAD